MTTETFTVSHTPSVKSKDPTTTRALALEGSVVKKSMRKRSSASHPAYVPGCWRPDVSNLSEFRARAATQGTKDLYLPPHRRQVQELAKRSKIATVQSYGENATSEVQYGPRDSGILADKMIFVLSGDIYIVSSFVDVDAKTMHWHDVAVDTCSVYNLVASKSLPLR